MNPVSSILPTITADLDIDVTRAGWLMNSYFVLLVSFVLIRAASFHHVDLLLRAGPVRLNWVLELGGIGLIALTSGSRSARVRAASQAW